MKAGKTLQELAVEIERQNAVKKDFIAPTHSMEMTAGTEQVSLALSGSSEIMPFSISGNTHRQIGTYTGIPAKYYDRMLQESPELLARNVNEWLGRTGDSERRMIRTLDGTARAFLSDKYRRIDNMEVAQAVLPVLGEMAAKDGAAVESCEITDHKMYLKVVNPRITTEVKKGDVVQAGIVISNSETGQGSLMVSPMVYRLVCTNGMILPDRNLRKYHVGRINEAGEDYSIYRDETVQADDHAFLMKIEDTIRAAMDQARFEEVVSRMRETMDAKIEPKAAPKVVELAAKEFKFTQEEGEGILGHLIAGGDLSLYGLANAVTRHSQDITNYDRATDLEAAGYQVLMMPPALWTSLNRTAAQ